ncbi:unnamed protein product [Acanthocheilonema viteae]|uniref:Uncharacterized protein n=1 Tax=Acanthocheilonema viteae TaxID=6277 RepID=A0A498SQM6_ACAVI|nr:unnamed protein product [Acanthocheilonema viteae]
MEAEIDLEAYSPSISSFDENFNCDEMYIITIDDPHVPSNSALSDADDINSDRKQYVTNVPARSVSRVLDEEIRQRIKALLKIIFRNVRKN